MSNVLDISRAINPENKSLLEKIFCDLKRAISIGQLGKHQIIKIKVSKEIKTISFQITIIK